MYYLKKTRSKLRGQSISSKTGNPNNNQVDSTPSSSNKGLNEEQCPSTFGSDLYSSSGSSDQEATLTSASTEEDMSSSTSSVSNPDANMSPSSKTKDLYVDVRNRMEALSLHSRMVHAFHHSQDGPSQQYNGEPTITFFAAWTAYLGYAVLLFVGHIRELGSKVFRRGRYHSHAKGRDFVSYDVNTYAPLLKSNEKLYTRRIYHRIQDCFNRPIASNPGATIHVLERISFDGNKTMQVLGKLENVIPEEAENYANGDFYDIVSGDRVTRNCLNLGSYNYLGFADDWAETCKDDVMTSMEDLPLTMGSSRMEAGTSILHDKVEKLVAEFIGKEASMVVNMGFNTNAATIPTLMGRGDLIVSDELNHTSIVNGARTSGSAIRCFRHNDTKHLEEILREAIVMGQPRTRRPWKKVMVIVEGIYSMEGEYCDLRNIVKVCKKYGAYVYLDEAHSIGAMGATGRGCTEYTGVDPADVDIMMGTFTKSFGGMGGYIAGDKAVIDRLRSKCAASSYHNSLSPIVCQQIISSFEVIMGRDGTDIGKQKIAALRDNSNYFRMRLCDMGLHVLGHYDSPIMPIMLYNTTKIAAFSRECLKRGLAIVGVGFPAVPILTSRARFCISAAHTREDLDRALKEIDEIADLLKIRYSKSTLG